MIVGRLYILQSLRNSKAFRPASNATAAQLKAYTRPVTGIGDYVFKLEAAGNEFLFRHESTGYYLTADGDTPGANIVLAALSGGGNSFQRWAIQGNDPSTRISPVSAAGNKQMTLISDTEGANVTTQPYGGSSNDELVSFNEYTAAPSGLVAPSIGRVFKNFTACDITNVAEGATVKVYVDDVLKNTVTAVTGGSTSVYLGTLSIGQKITVEQVLNTVTSARSGVEYVQELARVWKEGYPMAFQYRAYKVVVTSVPDRDNVETIVGTKGEPMGPHRSTYNDALADATNGGITETTY